MCSIHLLLQFGRVLDSQLLAVCHQLFHCTAWVSLREGQRKGEDLDETEPGAVAQFGCKELCRRTDDVQCHARVG
jgi:hypothetical protein